MRRAAVPTRPDYGQDVPDTVNALALVGAAMQIGGAGLWLALRARNRRLATVLSLSVASAGTLALGGAGFLIWLSRVAKVRERSDLFDAIPWRGDERVLDVGCGRGLLLVGAARRLTTGSAVGIDIWDHTLLSGNRPAATLANAAAEGVADRVTLREGDARHLPFPDAGFDVVLSSLMLHHMSHSGRTEALREMVRVLRPGGRLAILDAFLHICDSTQVLREHGVEEVWVSGPYALVHRMVVARKPLAAGPVDAARS
jgi:SAM-dependent methyltransferase